jgi:hypothetical protein
VARNQPDDPPQTIRLGLSLPSKIRHSIQLSIDAIDKVSPPHSLLDIVEKIPPAFKNKLLLIHHQFGDKLRMGINYYYTQDKAYLTDQSDIDLIFYIVSQSDLESLMSFLNHSKSLSQHPGLDGEICLKNGYSFSWKEYTRPTKKILIKTHSFVSLLPRETLVTMIQDLPQ